MWKNKQDGSFRIGVSPKFRAPLFNGVKELFFDKFSMNFSGTVEKALEMTKS